MRFTKDGKFVKEWGRKGSGRGEISEPHTIAMDSRGRLFVGDRENNRIQIFDQDGKLPRPSGGSSAGRAASPSRGTTRSTSPTRSPGPDTGAHELPGIKKGIRIGSAQRRHRSRAFIEDMESTAPDHSGAEGVGVDAQGNVYGAVVRRQMLERHVKAQPGRATRTVTPAEYERWKKELSNWGRWGKDDRDRRAEPDHAGEAAAGGGAGARRACRSRWPPTPTPSRPSTIRNPYEVTMLGIGSDRIAVNYHGIAHTHLDSLAHINDQRRVLQRLHAGRGTRSSKQGHAKNSIHNVKNGIFTRGILIDIPRLKGVPYLEPGTPIYVEDLEAWEKQAGVRVSAGRRAVRPHRRLGAARRPSARGCAGRAEGGRSAGLDPSVIPWLKAARRRAAGQRSPAVRLAGRSSAARRGARFRAASIWACTCSTTAISRRSPRRRRRASAGSSC